MKILVISTAIFPVSPGNRYAGIETLVRLISNELNRRDHQVSLVAPQGSRLPKGIEHINTGSCGDFVESERRAYWICSPRLQEFEAILDFSHSHWCMMENDLPAVAFIWHDPYIMKPQEPSYNICALSQWQANRFRHIYGYEAKVVDPHCGHPGELKPAKGNFLFLGRMGPQKGCLEAIDICHELGVSLDIIGGSGPGDPPEYLAKVEEGCHSGVVYQGEVDDSTKTAFLEEARALIYPINYPPGQGEAHSHKIVDTLLCGCPVVTYNTGAFPEIIEHEVTGYLAKDREEFKKLMMEVDNLNPGTIRERAIARWSVEATVDRLLEAAEKVSKGERWGNVVKTPSISPAPTIIKPSAPPAVGYVKYELKEFPRQIRLDTINACNARCLPPNEKVILTNFSKKRITDIEVGDGVLSATPDNQIQPSIVVNTFQTAPLEPMVRIRTEHMALQCTPNHAILTPDGWIEAQHLDLGDYIGCIQGAKTKTVRRGKRETTPGYSRLQQNSPANVGGGETAETTNDGPCQRNSLATISRRAKKDQFKEVVRTYAQEQPYEKFRGRQETARNKPTTTPRQAITNNTGAPFIRQFSAQRANEPRITSYAFSAYEAIEPYAEPPDCSKSCGSSQATLARTPCRIPATYSTLWAKQERSANPKHYCPVGFQICGGQLILGWPMCKRKKSEPGLYLEERGYQNSDFIPFTLLARDKEGVGRRPNRIERLSSGRLASFRNPRKHARNQESCPTMVGWERIIAIDAINPAPAYDIEVWPYHNFIAGDGIVVHNCTPCHLNFQTRPHGQMSMEMITKVLDELKVWPKPPEELVPVNFGEFFLRKDWYDILRLIEESLPQTRIALPTNGSLLNDDTVRKLASISTLKWLNFSVNAFFKETYEAFTGLKAETVDKVKEAIIMLRSMRPDITTCVSMIFDTNFQTEMERDLFIEFWRPLASIVSINPAAYCNSPLEKPLIPVKTACRSIFDGLTVLYDGRVVTNCCWDSDGLLEVGNANEDSLLDIWKGGRLTALCELHNEGRRDEVTHCLNCTFA